MADEKKILKFQMMMSLKEAATLDDWMFKNRVRSRAEAIRRLTQMGMLVDDRLPAIISSLVGQASKIDELRGTAEKEIKESASKSAMVAYYSEQIATMKMRQAVLVDLVGLAEEIAQFSANADIEEAIDLAGKIRKSIAEIDFETVAGAAELRKVLDGKKE